MYGLSESALISEKSTCGLCRMFPEEDFAVGWLFINKQFNKSFMFKDIVSHL